MAHRGRSYAGRGPVLRRTGRNDAARRRSICLLARSVLAALGIFVWLDSVFGYPDGDDRRFISRFLSLSWRVVAPDLRDKLHHSAHSYPADLCALALDCTTGGTLGHFFSHLDEYEGPQVRKGSPK